nr:radical SAM family heme chaperone HemW [Pseudobdellovibrionaceae bacterium]
MNKFGIYIHIPYCIQRCSYCDFATYERSQIMHPSQYVDLILKEIQLKHTFFSPQELTSIYFGGGTPSLIEPFLLKKIMDEVFSVGFTKNNKTEITIEINPATLTDLSLEQYLNAGFNRFSVGAQTFNDRHLKNLGREHNVEDTLQTLGLLKKYKTNFSLDLLFAIPHQTMTELKHDIDQALDINPSHISTYCLTLQEGHPLNQNRPMDEDQIEMFNEIHTNLSENSYSRYEISNYSLSEKESQHNLLYWTDQEYWGVGLGAHSYAKPTPNGVRFWNDRGIKKYEDHINSLSNHAPLTSPLQLE